MPAKPVKPLLDAKTAKRYVNAVTAS